MVEVLGYFHLDNYIMVYSFYLDIPALIMMIKLHNNFIHVLYMY